MSNFKILLGSAGVPTITDGGTLKAVGDISKIGLHAMEVQFSYGVRMGNQLAKKVGDAGKRHNVSLSVHAPYYINLCTDDQDKLEASKKRILKSADRANLMGAKIVTFHPGFYGDLTKDEAFDKMLLECKDIENEVPDSVKLGMETMGKSAVFGTVDEVLGICNKLKKFEPVFDFGHIYARNTGKIDYNKIFKKIRKSGITHIHSHFSNVEFTGKGEKRHIPLGDNPPFEELAKIIMKKKIGITIISETPKLEQDALKMKRIIEDIGYEFG